jgi:PAS domain S-box-containing protein
MILSGTYDVGAEDSEQLFRDLLESAHIILWQMDVDSGKFTLVTRQTEEILSIPAEEWLTQENFWRNHLHPDDLATARGKFADAIESNSAQTFEHRMRTADGSYKWLRTSVRLVSRAGRRFLSGAMLDVTERMLIEAALHEERSLFDALMDTLPDHIYFKDLNSCFLRVNEAHAADLRAASSLSMIGLSDADFFGEAHAAKAFADEQEIVQSGNPLLDVEEEEHWPDGREQWLTTSKLPLRNVNGEIVGTFGVSRDITERKLADKELLERSRQLEQANEKLRREIEERRLLESQLLQAQKLEAIGQLAAGVAHEINTPIQYVGDNCHFLVDSFQKLKAMLSQYDKALGALRSSGYEPELVSETDECLAGADLAYLCAEIPVAIEQSLEGVERVARIVRAMKEFSHPGSGQKEAIDLNHAIENTLMVCRNEWKYVAEAVTDLDSALPPVHCLPGEMNQVLLNLVVNAAHAIDQAKRGIGKIVVSTKRDGKFAEVRVADNGAGIPAAIQGRIFDPFFTTKEVGKGTGQGLTLARNIVVKKHHGTLTFETEENQGTTFIARIPIEVIDLETERGGIVQ